MEYISIAVNTLIYSELFLGHTAQIIKYNIQFV